MRSTGVVDSAGHLGHHDHLCWGYEHPRNFRDEALVFVDEGLSLGHRILYTGEADTDGLRAELEDIAELDRLIDDGAIQLLQILATYDGPAGHDQAEVYAAATRNAVGDGFTGLRAVADATVLVLDPTDRDAFVRYEHRIDRLMAAGLPFSAMCGYDRERLGEEAVAEIGCVHPLVHHTGATFQIHSHHGGTALRLAGDIDAWHEVAVEDAFVRTLAAREADRLIVDCSDLAFTHHRGLEAMDRAARDAGVALGLQCAPTTCETIIDLLHLHSLEIMAA